MDLSLHLRMDVYHHADNETAIKATLELMSASLSTLINQGSAMTLNADKAIQEFADAKALMGEMLTAITSLKQEVKNLKSLGANEAALQAKLDTMAGDADATEKDFRARLAALDAPDPTTPAAGTGPAPTTGTTPATTGTPTGPAPTTGGPTPATGGTTTPGPIPGTSGPAPQGPDDGAAPLTP